MPKPGSKGHEQSGPFSDQLRQKAPGTLPLPLACQLPALQDVHSPLIEICFLDKKHIGPIRMHQRSKHYEIMMSDELKINQDSFCFSTLQHMF